MRIELLCTGKDWQWREVTGTNERNDSIESTADGLLFRYTLAGGHENVDGETLVPWSLVDALRSGAK